MPSSSEAQRRLVFAKRGQYKTKSATPDKWKWVWNDDWLTIEEDHIERYKPFDFDSEDSPDEVAKDSISKSVLYSRG